MTAPDLTGWNPHTGGEKPRTLPHLCVIVPLFRGRDTPHEGAPITAESLDWEHHPEPDTPPTPMDILTGKAKPGPSADVIAWRFPADLATRYSHVRADIFDQEAKAIMTAQLQSAAASVTDARMALKGALAHEAAMRADLDQ